MVVHTHNYSALYCAANSLEGTSARVEVRSLPQGGFVFEILTEGLSGPVTDGPYQNGGEVPFETVEEALAWALQFHSYPDVAVYLGPLA